MSITIVSAVNDDQILESCLSSSAGLIGAVQVLHQRGFASAASAYNDALDRAATDLVIFVHQDMYFPEGWLTKVADAIAVLTAQDPTWGVAGVFGVDLDGQDRGHLYCNGNQTVLGAKVNAPVEVVTLDEVVLILRRSSGLRFDNNLLGFHFYGTDICLQAKQLSRKAYVISGFCLHNSNGYGMFPRSFWEAYFAMRRKWWSQLPVRTPCIRIQRSLCRIVVYNLRRYCWLKRRREPLASRVADPVTLYRSKCSSIQI